MDASTMISAQKKRDDCLDSEKMRMNN